MSVLWLSQYNKTSTTTFLAILVPPFCGVNVPFLLGEISFNEKQRVCAKFSYALVGRRRNKLLKSCY